MNTKLPKLVKRQAYNDYSKFEKDIPAVLNRLINTQRGDLQQVSQETGIPYSTISRWHQQLCKNTRFNPLDRKWGQHSRIFTGEEEDSIADYIITNYIQQGAYFTDEDFVEIATEASERSSSAEERIALSDTWSSRDESCSSRSALVASCSACKETC